MATEDLNLNKNAEAAGGKGKGKLFLILGVVLALAGGGGAYWFLAGGGQPAAEDTEAAAPVEEEQDPIYLPMERYLVNFDYKGSIRYVQADMQLLAFDQDIIDKASLNMPALRNRIIMLLSAQDFEALRKVEGKEALRQAVLVAVNETLKASGPKAVQDVFFTSFVLQ